MRKKHKVNDLNQTRVARFSLFFFRHFKVGIAFWLGLFLFGFFSYTTFMQRQGFPQVSVPIGVVQSIYFVNDKTKVDEQVTQSLLSIIDTQDYVKSSSATTSASASTIVVEYEESLTSKEGAEKLEAAVNAANLPLPQAARVLFQPIDAGRINNKYDVLVSLSADPVSQNTEQLNKAAAQFVQDVKPHLTNVESIEVVTLYREGVNPVTGMTESRQEQFDWFGKSQNGSLNVRPSVVVGIRLADDADIVAFDTKLQDAITTVAGPYNQQGISINEAAGFAPSIKQQIKSLQKNLIEGLVIVILIACIFIGLRAGIMAALGMIMTLTISIGVMYAGGNTLNTITLFGLVLCLGLIVDDIVIMIEAIDRQRREHKALPDAIGGAASRIALASSAGTMTTVLGFAPLLFFGGILGEFIRVLPITIIVSLIVSLFVSLAFIPFISRWAMKSDIKSEKKQSINPLNFVRKFVGSLGDSVAGLIEGANTTKRKVVMTLSAILISLAFIFGTGFLFQKVPFDIFPTAKDSDTVQVTYDFSPTVTLEEAIVLTNTANQKIVAIGGKDIEKISYQGNATAQQASAELTLIPYEERERTATTLVNELQTALNDTDGSVEITVSQVSAGPPKERLPFKAQINADNPAQADKVAKSLVVFLEDRKITRSNGTSAAINEVVYEGELATITRRDGQRIVEVAAGFDAVDTSALVQTAQKEVEKNFVSDSSNLHGLQANDINFDFGIESDNQDSFKTVLLALPILVLCMYILLALQFRSLFQPLLILIAVPFSFFGVSLALLLSDNPFSFFVMIGFFALIGISVNNTILLTDFANQGRRKGLSPRAAMADAVRQRIRPLLTTSITSVAALLPLALSDPFWESLAVTLIGGLIASTLLVIISFPYYYLVMEFFRSRASLRWKKRRLARAKKTSDKSKTRK